MNGTLYEQIITLLTVPPGNLVYHLVLAFSIAGALPGAFTLWQRSGKDTGRRMVIGLCWLLLAQFLLILDAGLAQFFTTLDTWLPILDRAVNAFSLVILIWLWVYPQGSRRVNTASLILSLFILIYAVLSGLWWANLPQDTNFNGTSADLIWSILSILLALAGVVLSLIRRPDGFGFGVGMFALLLTGQVVYLLDPLPAGNYPGFVRLSQVIAFPILLTLPTRFSWGGSQEMGASSGLEPATYDHIKTIATKSDPVEVCQAVTAIVAQALQAGLCLMISPPDTNQHIKLFCGYDLGRREILGAATFDSQLVPVLSESLRQARPLHLPAEGQIPDLEGLGKVLNLTVEGSILSAPILTRSGEMDKALVLVSQGVEGSWSAADQNYLADIASSLTGIYEFKNEYTTQSEKLARSNANLQNIMEENKQLNQEMDEIRSANLADKEQIQQLQSDLENALDELNTMKATRSQGKE
ncbi:MAG: hypothetical protein ACWGOY_12575 [Anaerolineales bacterium]